MLEKTLFSPLMTYNYATCFCISTFIPKTFQHDVVTSVPNIAHLNLNSLSLNETRGASTLRSSSSQKWLLCSTLQIENVLTEEEDKKTWEACREALNAFDFGVEEADKILGKAFGQVHSPYWGEDRKKVVPKFDILKEIMDYLRSLSLSDDDLRKVLKKFPEVLGCNLQNEIKNNVQILEKEWGIKGKTLRNLLLRNPRVLGYNVDCKGDCMAQCTRCWVRF